MHGVAQQTTALQSGGNMEGKEVRFGISQSSLFAAITTDESCGAVNSMHDSFTPLGGMVPLINIMLGEIVFGGVGSGLYGMLIYVVLAVFIAGLMVGRTPEYLGKKIEAYDVKMAMLYILIFPLLILVLTAISVLAPNMGLTALNNTGPHGLTEILYAFTSSAGNNGSAFAGISANTHWYNISLGFTMLAGRFLMMIPDARHRRQPGDEEERAALARNLPREHDPLLRTARRSHPDRRRADLLPGAKPRAHPRTPAAALRAALLGKLSVISLQPSVKRSA